MALIIQKYGGSSVKSVERIKAVSERIYQRSKEGNQIVVVVSAMGKTTDGLVKLASDISSNPSHREMDMLLSTGEQVSIALLSIALQELGHPAISLTGAQVGIVTEAHHSKARILEIKTTRIQKHLQEGKVVVVAGFQGVSDSEDLEITTLGRGGSDTSGVALAAALKADFCEIYTDVPGILTTDPRIVPEATLLDEITCNEMLELASLGAKVLHPRAVEIARNYGVPLVVRSSWSHDPGTKVNSSKSLESCLIGLEITKAVDTIEFEPNQAKVSFLRIPDHPGIAASLFGEIAKENIDVDLIIQSIHEGNTNDIAFTIANDIVEKAQMVSAQISGLLSDSKETDLIIEEKVAKISINGAGMIGRPGIAAKMFKTLADANINIQMISTSEVKVSCIIAPENCNKAIAHLCEAFEIDHSMAKKAEKEPQNINLAPVRGVALDENQAQLAILFVPDLPGIAAKIFTTLAQENISVDMIIQSQRCRMVDDIPKRDIAFTVAQSDAQLAQKAIEKLRSEIGFKEIVVNENIAKLSIVGAGMIDTPGVATKFFEALAKETINILMISSSEIKVSCIVNQDQGNQGLKAAHKAFNLEGNTKLEVPSKED